MRTSVAPQDVTRRSDMLGEDLASLACNAAIELDNLILGHSDTVEAVRNLGNRLNRELPATTDVCSQKYLVDPSTVVVMSRVIQEASWPGPASEIQELTHTAGEIAGRLLAVGGDPIAAKADAGSLEQLRTFCLILSKRAAAARGSMTETKPPHPYRKQG